MSFTEENKRRALEHVRLCDLLFDGKREDGTQSTLPPSREFAYNQMRVLVFELLEVLEKTAALVI